MANRRDFLKVSSLIALAPTVPGFLARTAHAADPKAEGRVLVVVQLDGGNDGINTVIPFKDEGYAKTRKTLRLADDRLLKIDKSLAFHPAMREAAKLLESGRLAIVPGVGYPNPNRSHFESMAIWQSARFDAEEHAGPGWLGRGFDEAGPGQSKSSAIFVGSGAPPMAVRGRRASASTLERLEDLLPDPAMTAARSTIGKPGADDDLLAFARRSELDAYATADRLAELARKPDTAARYPQTGLADRLRLVARLLKGGFGARVFYTTQGGYDTHSGQSQTHFGLLSELSGAIKAFLDDLADAKLADRVVVLGFSEFGRRVAENDSDGTDHGTAGPVLLAGPAVKAGVQGAYPSLTDLVDGDLKTTVDFRHIYATVLERWLGLPSRAALGGEFPSLDLLQA
jgi:uncharacterized protein (DUF1501 family)